MTACPIRYQRQVSDRKGKIFYTSITSLSHISKGWGRIVINLYRLLWMIFERKLIIFIRPIHCSLNIELLKK